MVFVTSFPVSGLIVFSNKVDHIGSSAIYEPPAISTKPKAAIPIPIAIFFGVDGSIFFALNQPNSPIIIGVKNTTKNGLIDWNNSAP